MSHSPDHGARPGPHPTASSGRRADRSQADSPLLRRSDPADCRPLPQRQRRLAAAIVQASPEPASTTERASPIGVARDGAASPTGRCRAASRGPCRSIVATDAHRRAFGSSKSSGSQYAFRIRWKSSPSLRSSAPRATLWELSPQSGCVQLHAVPGLVRLPQEGVQAHALTLMLHVAQRSPRGEQAHEAVDVGVLRQRASSRTSWSRRPGNRRCCCRAACAGPRLPSGSWARPATSA